MGSILSGPKMPAPVAPPPPPKDDSAEVEAAAASEKRKRAARLGHASTNKSPGLFTSSANVQKKSLLGSVR